MEISVYIDNHSIVIQDLSSMVCVRSTAVKLATYV